MKRFILSILIALFCTALAQADPTVSLIPASGNGFRRQWKRSLGGGSHFTMTQSLELACLGLYRSLFLAGPAYGNYVDYIYPTPNSSTRIAPSATF